MVQRWLLELQDAAGSKGGVRNLTQTRLGMYTRAPLHVACTLVQSWLGAEEKHTVITCTPTGWGLHLPPPVLLISSISFSVIAKSERQALLISHLTGEETGGGTKQEAHSLTAMTSDSQDAGCPSPHISSGGRQSPQSSCLTTDCMAEKEEPLEVPQTHPDVSQVPLKASSPLLRPWQLPLAHAQDSGFSLQR